MTRRSHGDFPLEGWRQGHAPLTWLWMTLVNEVGWKGVLTPEFYYQITDGTVCSSIPGISCCLYHRAWDPVSVAECSCYKMTQQVKNLTAMQETQETWIQSLSWEDPLEKEITTLFSILAWRTPWTEEPGGLQSTGLQRVRRDWATKHTVLAGKSDLRSEGYNLFRRKRNTRD